jgi:hypothetical protein
LVLVGLGRLQDLLQEGVLIVPGYLVLRGQIGRARRGGVLHGLVDLLLDNVVVVVWLDGGWGSLMGWASHG